MIVRGPAIILFIIACAVLVVGCGSGKSSGAEPGAAATAALQKVSTDMLEQMIPGANDLQGFVRDDARLLDNAGASEQASDPEQQKAHLDEIGRVIGFDALFEPSSTAPQDAPNNITWSVNLFRDEQGALEFVKEPMDQADGVVVEPLDVSSLGADAVGYIVKNSDSSKPQMGYVVAFAEGNVEGGLTALYQKGSSSADFVMSLAQQAESKVKDVIDQGPAQSSAGS